MVAENSTCQIYRKRAAGADKMAEEGHDHCAQCRRWAEGLSALRRALGELPPPALPPGFEADLLRRLKRDERPRAWGRVRPSWTTVRPRAVMAAAMAALVVAGALELWPAPGPTPLSPDHGLIVTLASAGAVQSEVVELELELPEGVFVASEDPAVAEARVLRWRERIGLEGLHRQVGLMAGQVGKCSVVMRARAHGISTTLHLPLRVSPTGMTVGPSILTLAPEATRSVLASLSFRGAPAGQPDA